MGHPLRTKQGLSYSIEVLRMIRAGNHLVIVDKFNGIFVGEFLDFKAIVFGRSPEEVIEKANKVAGLLDLEGDSTENFYLDLGSPEYI